MALLSIDELNTPKVEVEPPEQYFSKMAISKEQKEERVETANDFMDVLLFFFALLALEMQAVQPDYDMVYRSFRQRWRDVVRKHSRMDDYQETYVNEYTQQQFDTTRRHMESVGVGTDGRTDAGWWTSLDRAIAIGESAANIVLNHEELLQAAEAGAVGKRWVDKADTKVRKTHLAVTKRIIPLAEYFAVGNGVMLFPCDWDNNPDECYNCRCSCQYYDKDGKLVRISTYADKENNNASKIEYSSTNETKKIPREFAHARFATGEMSMEELARANELWYSVKEIEGISAKEKEMVYEEFDNNLTAEEKSSAIVCRPIGDYWYKAVNRGHNQYKIFGKQPIDPYEDDLDEVLSEVIGRDWKQYDIQG